MDRGDAGLDGQDDLWALLVPTDCAIPREGGALTTFSVCFEVDIECPDLDPWPETDVDEYLKNKDILSWYGWGW